MELIPGSPRAKSLLNWWPAPRRNAAWDRCSNQIPWKPRLPWRYRKREAGLSAAWHRSKRTRQDLQMECWKHVSSPSGDHQQGMWHWDVFSGAKLGFRRSSLCLGPQAVQGLPRKESGSHPSSSVFISHHPSSPTWFFHRAALPHMPCALSYLQREAEAFSTQAILN